MTLEPLLIFGLVLNGVALMVVSGWATHTIANLRAENAKLRGRIAKEFEQWKAYDLTIAAAHLAAYGLNKNAASGAVSILAEDKLDKLDM